VSIEEREVGKLSLNPFTVGHPFGKTPQASREEYLHRFDIGGLNRSKAVYDFESLMGFAVDLDWLDSLALQTQVVIKKSPLDWNHGRVLYTVLRSYLSTFEREQFTYLETGTARGFSAVVAARACLDSSRSGNLITIDTLPHETSIMWNCIADHEGPQSRRQLISKWVDECELITFVQSRSSDFIVSHFLPQISFAFLDGAHDSKTVTTEFEYVAERQVAGDVVVFDDVTPSKFPGICQVVESIRRDGKYTVKTLESSDNRGYAVCTRN